MRSFAIFASTSFLLIFLINVNLPVDYVTSLTSYNEIPLFVTLMIVLIMTVALLQILIDYCMDNFNSVWFDNLINRIAYDWIYYSVECIVNRFARIWMNYGYPSMISDMDDVSYRRSINHNNRPSLLNGSERLTSDEQHFVTNGRNLLRDLSNSSDDIYLVRMIRHHISILMTEVYTPRFIKLRHRARVPSHMLNIGIKPRRVHYSPRCMFGRQ